MNFDMDQAPGTEYLIFRCAQLGKSTYYSWSVWGTPPTMVISNYVSEKVESCKTCHRIRPQAMVFQGVCADCGAGRRIP